jgi:hypothetical protein
LTGLSNPNCASTLEGGFGRNEAECGLKQINEKEKPERKTQRQCSGSLVRREAICQHKADIREAEDQATVRVQNKEADTPGR